MTINDNVPKPCVPYFECKTGSHAQSKRTGPASCYSNNFKDFRKRCWPMLVQKYEISLLWQNIIKTSQTVQTFLNFKL